MKKTSTILLLVLSILATSVCLASNHTPVSISSFHSLATIPVTPTTVTPVATCPGVDGTYTLLSVVGSGPITSNDPRMAGIFHVDALILDSPATGLGASVDNWTITDPATGEVKARGKALATDLGPNPRSITIARLLDGSHMIANAVVTLPAPGAGPITIEYGGPGLDVPDRGVIIGGDNPCVKELLKAVRAGI